MPPKDIPVNIVKIPLPSSEKHKDHPQVFKLMPVLYLELLENKNKIKQDLINKNYVPPKDITALKSVVDPVKKDVDKNPEVDNNHKSNKRQSETDKRSVSISDSEKDKDKDLSSSKSSESETDSDSESVSDNRSRKTSSSENLSERLKMLLKNKASTGSEKSDKSQSHSKFTPYDKYKKSVEVKPSLEPDKPIPTLTELEQRGQFNPTQQLRNIDHIPSAEYDEEDRKRELLFKFELLKKSYKNSTVPIPEATIHTNLNEMQKLYDGTVKRLSLDTTVDNYKNYLLYGFMITEYVFGSVLGFDMAGFTQHQVVNMNGYERLLVELGEKSYVPTGSKWPVELQLLFMIVMNAGMFIVGKMVLHKVGNVMGQVKMMNEPSPKGSFEKPKRKMKGPDNLEDITTTPASQQTKNEN